MQTEKQHHPHRRALVTGFIALFPLVLTVIVLRIIWRLVLSPISVPLGKKLTDLVAGLTPLEEFPGWADWIGIAAALVFAVLAVYLLGKVLTTFVGRRLLSRIDTGISSLPVIGSIYPHAKQISGFIFAEEDMQFQRVVAIEYPRRGCYSLGFATSDGLQKVAKHTGSKLLAVFVPTSPTPITGWTVMVPEEEVISLELTVDEAIRFILSCGVLTPSAPHGPMGHESFLVHPPGDPVNDAG
ncbi:MAG: DUF502 domain-containing protein [Acidobacteria bacterium]|nr:DUF502 domain-containing protein [Acidobacteriota bacterium]